MMKVSSILSIVLLYSRITVPVCGLQTLFKDFKNPFVSSTLNNKNNENEEQMIMIKRREELKQLLLNECRKSTDTSLTKRQTIESLMDELSEYCPTSADGTASSPLLKKNWCLEYTTEKEINFFIDLNLSSHSKIFQLITTGANDDDDCVLNNVIRFNKGNGFLGVTGALSLEKEKENNKQRTNFEFVEATLDFGELWGGVLGGPYKIPPVGKGWFDTIFLDETMRVDVNSRNDILILTAENSNSKEEK